jgi:TPR repeat protein
LIQAQKSFPKEAIIAYNLACYDCQLGDLDAAKAWLDKACTLGDVHKIKLMALQDPDLKLLWPDIRKA